MGEEPKSLFRQKALDKLARTESLDDRIIIVTAKSWMLLAGFYALLLCLLIWSIFGTIPVRVEGQGLLLHGNSHVYNASVTASSGGIVEKLLVQPGNRVTKNQMIAVLDQPQLTDQVKIATIFVERLEAQYHALEAQARKNISSYQQQADSQIQLLNNTIFQTRIVLEANKTMLAMRQKLFKEGIEDKQTVVEAIQAYQESKTQIDTALQQIAQNKKDELTYEEQWSNRLDDLKNNLTDKQKALKDLEKQYNTGKYVRSPIAGQVISTLVSPGDFVSVGKAVANITPEGKGLDAIVFVPGEDGKRIKQGMAALVYPSIIRKNEYGGIYGKVTHVSAYPAPPASILSALQDPDLIRKFNSQGGSFSVHIMLRPSTTTYSGLAWSSSQGPRQTVTPGTLVSATITVDKRRPISLLIPALRTLVEGS